MQGVPTVGEAGFPDLTTEDYAGFFYPAHTPSDRVQQLQAAVKDALRQPAVQERLRHLTFRPSGAETAQFAQRVRADYDKWRQSSRTPASGRSTEMAGDRPRAV